MTTQYNILARDYENIYVNVSLENTTNENIPCKMNVNFTQPIVKQGNKYKLCIVRFDVPMNEVQETSIFNRFNKPNVSTAIGLMYNNTLYMFHIDFNVANPKTLTDFLTYLNRKISGSLGYGITWED
jgi:hypothetical protein